MQYRDIVQTQEWQSKQHQILERDGHTCQRCCFQESQSIPTFTSTLYRPLHFIECEMNLYGGVRIIQLYEPILGQNFFKSPKEENSPQTLIDCSLVVHFVEKKVIQYPFSGGILPNAKSKLFDISPEFRYNIRELFDTHVDFDQFEIDKHGLYLVPTSRTQEFVKRNLQVHHRCYRHGMMFWEQPQTDYTTVCNECHRIVHQQQLIPILATDDSIIKYLRPCWKCSGQRYFDCYDGLCYECDGEGFKQDSPEWLKYLNSFLPWNQ